MLPWIGANFCALIRVFNLWEQMTPHPEILTTSSKKSSSQGTYKIPALHALSEITASLSSDNNLEELLERFLSTMIRLSGADAGAVRIITSDGKHLRLVGSIGLPQDVVDKEEYVPLECGICGHAAREHSIQSDNHPSLCREVTALNYFGDGCKNVIAVPLRHKGKVMGVYNLFMSSDSPIPEDLSLLFFSISEHLGIALENARLTRENMRISLTNERQMLANEIHDSLAQTIAYMKMRVALLREALIASDETMSNKYLNDVDEAVESAYSGLRDLLGQFRYRMDPRGLVPALEDVMLKYCDKSMMNIDFVNFTQDLNLTPNQEVQVFHIVQEALINICKHARAQRVKLTMEIKDGQYLITVEDDGVGLKSINNQQNGLHFGLNIMRERAQRLGGDITIESQIGEGTRLQLKFPLTSDRKDKNA